MKVKTTQTETDVTNFLITYTYQHSILVKRITAYSKAAALSLFEILVKYDTIDSIETLN